MIKISKSDFALLNLLPQAVAIVSKDKHVFVNTAFTKLFGYSNVDIKKGLDVFKLIKTEDKSAVEKKYLKIQNKRPAVIKKIIELVTKKGAILNCQTRSNVIEYENEKALFIVIQDITERVSSDCISRIQTNLSIKLSGISDFQQALDCILDSLLEIENVDSGGIYIFDSLTNSLELVACRGLTPSFVKQVKKYRAKDQQYHIVMAGKPVYSKHNLMITKRSQIIQREHLTSLAVIPINVMSTVVGALNLSSHSDSDIPVNARDLMESIANQIGEVLLRVQSEKALKLSEERFRNFYNRSPLSYQSLSESGCFLDINPAWSLMTGYSRSEVLGKPFSGFLSQKSSGDFVQKFNRLKKKGEANDIIFDFLRKDQKKISVNIHGKVECDSDGNFLCAHCILRDVSERLRADNAVLSLIKSEAALGKGFYENLVKNLVKNINVDFAFVSELDNLNKKKATTLAVCARGKIRPNFSYNLDDTPCGEIFVSGDCCYGSGVAGLFPNDNFSRINKIEGYIGIALKDSQAKVVGFIVVLSSKPIDEVSVIKTVLQLYAYRFEAEIERKKAEEALRNSEQTLKSIFRAAPTGIGLICNRCVLQVNDRVCEITGYQSHELIGKSARIFYPSEKEFSDVGTDKYKQIEEKGTGTVETRWKRKDGKIIDVLLSSTPIDQKDLSRGVTFTALDITYRKKAVAELKEYKEHLEKLVKLRTQQLVQAERLAATGRLAASIAHEINNPLQGIVTHLELLKPGLSGKSKLLSNYDFVKENICKIGSIVGQLLDIYRGSEKTKSSLELNGLIRKVAKLVQNQFEMKGVDLRLDFDARPIVILGWPQQLHQVVLNLLLNALENTNQGGWVRVSTALSAEKIDISVKDTGRGIDPDHLSHIFDPFFSTKQDSGVGLGLFVCQGLIKNHQGDIRVNSSAGKGAEFFISLPLS
ncbi:MAG: PAS domain S-box protein [Candidatus Omnitrophica bacterium]|nr:PAS domain S-box protein [Candidatus Omnitrophota bacterium]